MNPHERAKLAAEQAALIDALAGRAGAPAAFDAHRLATAAASLLAKRRRGVEKAWPGLAKSLGGRFRSAFAEYAHCQPMPREGSVADGRSFARHLRRRGLLPDGGRVQLLLAELGRFRPMGVAFLPQRRELVVAFRTFRGARWFTLRCPGRRGQPDAGDFSQPLRPAAK